MRVLMVTRHGCIRVWKEARALQGAGIRVDCASQAPTYGFNAYDRFNVYHDREQLQRLIRETDVDLVHVHNEPDDLVVWVGEALAGRHEPAPRLVFDVHDLTALRYGYATATETAAFEAAHGFIHISEPCYKAAEHFHAERMRGKPSAVLPCFMDEGLVAPDTTGPFAHGHIPMVRSVVYEGGISESPDLLPYDCRSCQRTITDGSHTCPDCGEHHDSVPLSMRSYQAIVEAFVRVGFEAHIYPASPLSEQGPYEQLGAVVHSPQLFGQLLKALRLHGFGIVGTSAGNPLMHAALPNKLFEYLSQGVVPIVFNADQAALFVEQEGVGYVVREPSDLADLAANAEPRWKAARERAWAKRHTWTMAHHVKRITRLYQAVLDAAS